MVVRSWMCRGPVDNSAGTVASFASPCCGGAAGMTGTDNRSPEFSATGLRSAAVAGRPGRRPPPYAAPAICLDVFYVEARR